MVAEEPRLVPFFEQVIMEQQNSPATPGNGERLGRELQFEERARARERAHVERGLTSSFPRWGHCSMPFRRQTFLKSVRPTYARPERQTL